MRDDAGFVALGEEAFDGFASPLTIVEREVVDPHRNESVRKLGLHVAGKLHGICECVFAIVHRVDDALVKVFRNPLHQFRPQIAADNIAAHRERKARFLMPPLAEIEHLIQTHLVIKELAFVYQQTSVSIAFLVELCDDD